MKPERKSFEEPTVVTYSRDDLIIDTAFTQRRSQD